MIAAKADSHLTASIGQDVVMRSRGASASTLDGNVDTQMPRAINDRWPVAALEWSFPAVGTVPVKANFVVGNVRTPAVSYLSQPLQPLWQSRWTDPKQMAASAIADASDAHDRASCLDDQITQDATAVGGPHYAALCDLALRQAFGGTELATSPSGDAWAFLKEISSDGNVSTVDVVYPASPAFLYASPEYLRMLLEPLVAYAEHGWSGQFAEHDIGAHYPVADGHPGGPGTEEDMPVEESANMLLMAAGYIKYASAQNGARFASAHYAVFKKWADYLTTNALDPGFQNQTDDFTGFIAHSVNLALKGILAIGAMGQIAQHAGNVADASSYSAKAAQLITQWASKGQDPSNQHMMLAYDQPGTWSLKYNAFYDKALGLNLIPGSVRSQEAAFYLGQKQAVGIPLDPRHLYTKVDWSLWTAAAMDDSTLRSFLVDATYQFVTSSPQRVPFSDWYETNTGSVTGFADRPVIGGVYALMIAAGKHL
jgi:hypothetical protein